MPQDFRPPSTPSVDPAPRRTAPQANASPWPIAAMWVAGVLAVANAAVFTWAAAGPLLAADNWAFIGNFLQPAFEHGAGIGDLLVKRAGFDHGQPLNKALMLANAHWFGLDFRIEAMVGVAFAALGLGLLLHASLRGGDAAVRRDPVVLAAVVAICAVYLSLNSSLVYTQSLVTLGFADYLLAYVVMAAAWRGLRGGASWWTGVAMLVYGVLGDNSALLTGVALALAVGLHGWKLGVPRRAAAVLGMLVVGLVLARLVYAGFGEVRGVAITPFDAPPAERLSALWAQTGDAWKWVVIPAASGLAYAQTLQYLAPEHWRAVQWALALCLVAGHLWFWRTALRVHANAAGLFAVSLMLLFYLYVAGLLYGRVYLAGADYLDQPRYVGLYLFGIVAILLMAISSRQARALHAPAARQSRPTGAVVVAASMAIVALQWPLTRHAWVEAVYLRPYYRGMAAQMATLARDPAAAPPADCAPFLIVCRMDAGQRTAAMRFLQRQRLNLFSPRFADAHPDLVQAAGLPAEVSR